jgi:hypothetical protein
MPALAYIAKLDQFAPVLAYEFALFSQKTDITTTTIRNTLNNLRYGIADNLTPIAQQIAKHHPDLKTGAVQFLDYIKSDACSL